MDDLKKKRQCPEAMTIFCNEILPCVVGKINYQKKRSTTLVSQIATMSDEAFGYLFLENIWDNWTKLSQEDMLKIVQGKVGNARRVEKENADGESGNGQGDRRQSVMVTGREGKWTFGKEVSSRKYKGWAMAGLERFNDLCDEVVHDRETEKGMEWEVAFLNDWKQKVSGSHGRQRQAETPVRVRPREELDKF